MAQKTIVIQKITYSMDNTSRNYTKSCAQILLDELDGSGLMDSAFDRWRDRDWFKEIVEKLENRN